MIARAWYVRCDQCGNPAEVSTNSAKDAKALALARGFVMHREAGGEVWLCPWGCKQRHIKKTTPEPLKVSRELGMDLNG